MKDFQDICGIYYVGDIMLRKLYLTVLIISVLLFSIPVYVYSSPENIAQEIISLEISLSSSQKKLEDLNMDIEAINREIKSLKEEEKGIDANMSVSRDKLRYWYRFLYIDGNISLLEVILNSEDMSDLFSRIYYIESIQGYYLDFLNRLKSLKADKERLSSDLASKRKELESTRNDLQSTIDNIQKLLSEKQRLYQMALTDENVKEQIEQGESLLQRFESLTYLMSHLSDLPWKNIVPSSVTVNSKLNGASAVIDEKSIEDIIRSDEMLKEMDLHLTGTGFVIEGPSSDKLSNFSLEGEMRLTNSSAIDFIPDRLTLGGIIIQDDEMKKILSSTELRLTLPPLPFGLKVESIELNEGYITLNLIR